MSEEIQRVAFLGADGNLGPALLRALVANNFYVTVLKRQSSKSADSYPSAVQVVRVEDGFSVESLVPVLQGQDAVIVSLRGGQESADLQIRLADAAAKAGVKRFIPADFGSVDSSSPMTQRLVPLYVRKTQVREHCQRLAREYASFSWTSLVCGHFFDWSLEFIHVFVKERRADILDNGDTKFSISTLARIAEATVKILQKPGETKDQMLYVQSFCVTQKEVIAAFEKATGGEKWKIGQYDSKTFEVQEKAKADAGDKEAIEELVWLLGTIDANWTKNEGFAMDLLGLKDEDLDTAVKKVVASAQ
ncbi:Hypothetical protein R9X50_00022500 [Acrodontium crateriforme]|uniref:NmrA-like domain-containing protein n=1 Tax=Acrodontium crateriforme TaxID=150365 RepID=A0AAQ3R6N0_9PEZI|nr:Hypothetical protein R9X50_00022500 [Acrodontium crateriforme]